MNRTALLLVPLLSGCILDAFGPDSPALSFHAAPAPRTDLIQTGTTAEGGDGSVSLRGRIGTPNPCQKVTGEVRRSGTTLELKVTARSTGGMCIQEPGVFGYTGTITRLDAGEYRLRVVHQHPGTGFSEPRIVLDTTVTAR